MSDGTVLALSELNKLSMRKYMRLKFFILISTFLLGEITFAQKNSPPDEIRVFAGALIYPAPGEEPIHDGIVVVVNGKITGVGSAGAITIPTGARLIDCKGKTMLAGLWNTHVHFMEPKWNDAANIPAQQLTKQFQDMLTGWGFTSVVDIGSVLQNTLALRRRVSAGDVDGPRILTAGMIIFPKDGVPFYITENVSPELIAACRKEEAATPEDAVRMVDEQLAQGADVVKIMVVSWKRINGQITPWPMPLSVVQAATTEAHRKGKLVFAHPSTLAGVELVLAGHVDILAHTSEESDRWDTALSLRLKAENVTLIPTLTLFDRNTNFPSIQKEVSNYLNIGGKIMFGTDVGYLTDYPAMTKEFGYLAQAGVNFQQILASLTTVPANLLGFAKQTGMIKKGMDADLVLLDGDPAQDINAFTHVAMTVRQGRIIYKK
jgi:imidazolonepropionase-like amidohydrolase